jgi:hypothetical protein
MKRLSLSNPEWVKTIFEVCSIFNLIHLCFHEVSIENNLE